MTQPYRVTGGHVDRQRPIQFEFDGARFDGFAGDTLASALLANGVHLVGRSFKYHRPRGILAAGVDEPNALVTQQGGEGRDDPNSRATMLPLTKGLKASSQNRWPSLRFDTGAVNDWLAPLFPAGFYYKTFLWPRRAWAGFYEPRIRSRAGLGPAPSQPDPDCYAQKFAHCDVLVVGGGAAGLAAAVTAAATGLRVILCDEQEALGSTLLYAGSERIEGIAAVEWRHRTLRHLAALPNVRLLPRTTAFGYFAQNFLGLVERADPPQTPRLAADAPARERLWKVRASRVVLAAGAIERPLVFADNDRPGIMLASAVQRYVGQYAVLPGRQIVACVADDSGYQAAVLAAAAGAKLVIVDVRSSTSPERLAEAHAAGIAVYTAHVPTATRGRLRVNAIEIRPRDADGSLAGRATWLKCDLVMMAGGWTPAVHLHSQSRGHIAWSEAAQAFLPTEGAKELRSAGACRGLWGLDESAADGRAAGDDSLAVAAVQPSTTRVAVLPAAGHRDSAKAFVDFQNDVTARDIRLAIREGFTSVEHIKRYTTLGMATDQGRTSNINGLAVAADALSREIPQVGVTTFRTPYTPVSFGALAGQQRGMGFDPLRTTPIHSHAQQRGAIFEDVGQWRRARYFPHRGEDMAAAVARECRAVRTSLGVFDASTLGKIEVVGPDAAEFMNRLYVNAWSKLEVGRCRYGVMLREDGFVFDDGVVGRLAADRFHVTTTTTGAANVLHHMEDYLQTEFAELKVWLTSVTEQWAVIAVQGANARRALEPLVTDINLGAEAFPHMAVREGHICGVPTRLFRVSFTGELGFEVNVPAAYGASIWKVVHAAVDALDGAAYGTETMHVLRAEKGYIIVGQETDGTVTADDAGLSWAVGKSKTDFVGRRSMLRPALNRPGRKQLVGLRSRDGATVVEEGAQLLAQGVAGARSFGHVTSSYFSATLGHPIALAMLADGRSQIGATVYATAANAGVAAIAVEVTQPVFFDREGHRLAT